jgi:RimJ/RimL family protein N-acetyltransferase
MNIVYDILMENYIDDTNDDVNEIIQSLSKKEQLEMNIQDGKYGKSNHVVKRCIKRVNNIPVAFFELAADGNNVGAAVAVRKDYQNKGYGSAVVSEGINWFKKSKYRAIYWWVNKNNKASCKLAEKSGLIFDPSSEIKGSDWILYKMEK